MEETFYYSVIVPSVFQIKVFYITLNRVERSKKSQDFFRKRLVGKCNPYSKRTLIVYDYFYN